MGFLSDFDEHAIPDIACLLLRCAVVCVVELSPLFPDTLMLGMEIRVKVSEYVKERIKALRIQNPGQYENIACLRSNAMKYLPNYFKKGQVTLGYNTVVVSHILYLYITETVCPNFRALLLNRYAVYVLYLICSL